ncbi:hypothetical protein MFIFM68171_09655 [Madurella fahalii]|uniref:Uncharacterized protein n=1 Tax=Madurella fahalii TaxID=1157608 RepID=A0ABQ0GNZ0_9PEZI
MAHFREENGATNVWRAGAEEGFFDHVTGPLEDALIQYKPELGTSPIVIVFGPGTASSTFVYKARVDEMKEVIETEYLEANWIVLQWKGGKSSCADPPGTSILNVFAETTRVIQAAFDLDGKLLSIDKTPCDTLPAS